MPHPRTFPLLAVLLFLLAIPASAQAMLVGAESNGELVNSNVTAEMQATALDKMQRQGVQIVRANWGWNEVAGACDGQSAAELENHENPCYDWSKLDSLVEKSAERRMQVLLTITRVPRWVTGSDNPMFLGTSSSAFNNTVAHYAAFHKAAATRFRAGSEHGTVRYWTIHNEPNSPLFWGARPDPARYALMYGRTAVALKSGFGGAQIAPGPVGPTGGTGGIRPVPFINAFQRAVIRHLPGGSIAAKKRFINGFAINPYPRTFAPSIGPRDHADHLRMQALPRAISVLDGAPITRGVRIWATEFGWETSGNLRVPALRQAQYVAEAFHWLDANRRVLIGISYGLTDPTDPVDWQSGTIYSNGRIKPAFTMFQRMVSVPEAGTSNRVRPGAMLSVWGRSNVSTSTGVLMYQLRGKRWLRVPGQRRASDGSITARVRATGSGMSFAVADRGNTTTGVAAGQGMQRTMSVR